MLFLFLLKLKQEICDASPGSPGINRASHVGENAKNDVPCEPGFFLTDRASRPKERAWLEPPRVNRGSAHLAPENKMKLKKHPADEPGF